MTEVDRDELARRWLPAAIHRTKRLRLPRSCDPWSVAHEALASAVMTWEPERSPFGAWLSQQIRGAATRARRNYRVAERFDPEDTRLSYEQSWPVEHDESANAILSVLSPRVRLVMILHVLQGLTLTEIARSYGVSPQAVSQWIAKDRPRIAELIKRDRRG